MTDLKLGTILNGISEPTNLEDSIYASMVDPDEEVEQDPILLNVSHQDIDCEIMTLGNFSVIIGKAKSRKSFLATLLSGIVVSNTRVKDIEPKTTGNMVYIDTEQGRWHVFRLAQRLKRIVGSKDKFRVFALRPFTPAERIERINAIINESPELVMVVIDGVRDLVYNINDEREATNVSTQLMKWTYDHKIHICCVIHQNKGDVNARGHIGSEVQNKAETVIEVEKVKGSSILSKVSFPYTRGMAPNDIYFTIQKGLPIIEDYKEKNEQ